MSAVISVADLSKRFRSVTVLENVALDVPEGSVFGLIGPNGVGKTTTIKILMNILKPTSGRVDVLGVASRALGPAEFACIGYLSENQEAAASMTVGDFL